MKKDIWLYIKYKNDLFDVKCSAIDREIKEIRSVDSAVNIASILSLEVTREIQDIIINKGAHHAL
jgi:hypothetical protein